MTAQGAVTQRSARRWFWCTLAATLAFRAWLAVVVPFTGDEAYFLVWGQYPDIGYYDHPPMIGWLLALLAPLSTAEWVLRLPVLLLPAALAFGTRWALPGWFGCERATADLAACVLLLVPMNVWNVLITTDAPLILFSFAATVVFARAAGRNWAGGYFLAGILLGFAFLAKYFAVLLGLGMIAWALLQRARSAAAGALGWVVLGALPAALLNLWWNYQACWSNIMFNAINRHEGAGLTWRTPALYLAALAYLAAPLLWTAWRERHAFVPRFADPAVSALLCAWLVPLTVFAALSPVKTIGLHWLLSFVPALVLSLAIALPAQTLLRCVRFFAVFAVLHALLAGVLAAVPLEAWNTSRLYARLVFQFRTPELVDRLAPYRSDYALATDNYSSASVMSYYAKRYVFVFGAGSSHARHDDLITDMREYAGRNILVLRRDAPLAQDYAPYFKAVEFRTVEIAGATFHLVLGRSLDYAAYREGVLKPVRDRWYRIPGLLPVGRCYFCERYFPQEACGR